MKIKLFFTLSLFFLLISCADSASEDKVMERERCYNNEDCIYQYGNGYICGDGYCHRDSSYCNYNQDCESGYICIEQQCEAGEAPDCYSNTDCSVNEKCIDGHCIQNQEDLVFYADPVLGNNYVFAITPNNNSVAKIDVNTLSVESIKVGLNPSSIITIPGKDIAFVLNSGSDEITVIDAQNDEVTLREIPIVANLDTIALSKDAKYLVVYTDWKREGSSDFINGNEQEINLINLENNETYILSVGYKTQDVVFNDTQAFVISFDGVTILNLADIDSDMFLETIPLSENILSEGIGREVYITNNGANAIVREGSSDVEQKKIKMVNLSTKEIKSIEFDQTPTDIDIFDDGKKALLTFGYTNEVKIIDIPEDFEENAQIDGKQFDNNILLSIVIDDKIFSYSPGGVTNILNITSTDSLVTEPILIRGKIKSLILSSDGKSVVIIHPEVTGSYYYSLVDLESKFTKKIRSDNPYKASIFSNISKKAVLIFKSVVGNEADIIDLKTFVKKDIELGSAPDSLGLIYGKDICYISQEHPEGRISFIDLDNSEIKTITGFELNSEIGE